MSRQGERTVHVKGQEPREVMPPLFSNFLGISRVAGEVQFEFVFLDLNQLANLLAAKKPDENTEQPMVEGKTVTKIVMPAPTFLQLKEHILGLFADIEKELDTLKEIQNGRHRATS